MSAAMLLGFVWVLVDVGKEAGIYKFSLSSYSLVVASPECGPTRDEASASRGEERATD
jgi:hypothetical protein